MGEKDSKWHVGRDLKELNTGEYSNSSFLGTLKKLMFEVMVTLILATWSVHAMYVSKILHHKYVFLSYYWWWLKPEPRIR